MNMRRRTANRPQTRRPIKSNVLSLTPVLIFAARAPQSNIFTFARATTQNPSHENYSFRGERETESDKGEEGGENGSEKERASPFHANPAYEYYSASVGPRHYHRRYRVLNSGRGDYTGRFYHRATLRAGKKNEKGKQRNELAA